MARHRAVRIGLDSRHDETASGMEGINSYTNNLHQRIYLCMPRVSHVSRVSYIQLMYIPVFRWSASWVCMCIPRVYAPINDPSCYPSNLNPGFLSNACVIICLEISPAMPSHWGSSNFVDDGGGAVFDVTGTSPSSLPSQPSFQHFRRSPFPGSPRGGYMQWNTSSGVGYKQYQVHHTSPDTTLIPSSYWTTSGLDIQPSAHGSSLPINMPVSPTQYPGQKKK